MSTPIKALGSPSQLAQRCNEHCDALTKLNLNYVNCSSEERLKAMAKSSKEHFAKICKLKKEIKLNHYGQLYGRLLIGFIGLICTGVAYHGSLKECDNPKDTIAAIKHSNLEKWNLEDWEYLRVEFHRLYKTLLRKDGRHFFVPSLRVKNDIETTHDAFRQEQKKKFKDASLDTEVEQMLKELYIQGIRAISFQSAISLIRNDLNEAISKRIAIPEKMIRPYIEHVREEMKVLKTCQIDEGDSLNICLALNSLLNVDEPEDGPLVFSFQKPDVLSNIVNSHPNFQVTCFQINLCSIVSHFNLLALPPLTMQLQTEDCDIPGLGQYLENSTNDETEVSRNTKTPSRTARKLGEDTTRTKKDSSNLSRSPKPPEASVTPRRSGNSSRNAGSKPSGRSFRLTYLVRKRKLSDSNDKDDRKTVKNKKLSKKTTNKKNSVFEILDWMNE